MGGSRIEISMEEYQSLRTENQRLYQTTLNQEEKMKALDNKINATHEFLEEIREISLYERLFEWGHIRDIIDGFFNHLPKIKENTNEEVIANN